MEDGICYMKNLTQISPDCNLQLSDLHDYPLNGIHHHHMKLARYLVGRGMTPQKASQMMYDKFNESPRRRVLGSNEIEKAVLKASRPSHNLTSNVGGGFVTQMIPQKTTPESFWCTSMQLPFEKPNRRAINNAVGATPMTQYDFWESSPVRVDTASSFEIVEMLFSENDLICCGKKSTFDTNRLYDWSSSRFNFSHICPNPNRVRYGTNMEGNLSAHCRDATGQRRYIIIESDNDLSFDSKASIIKFLQVEAEAFLKMIVHSAGKSLHAWFNASECEHENWRFINFACLLGADSRMWLPEQFARMPNAIREGTDLVQKCIYFDPNEN